MGLANVNTTHGLKFFKSLSVVAAAQDVKTSEAVLFDLYAVNVNAAARYLKLYNAKAADVTVGTTVPDATFYLPASGANPVKLESQNGVRFSTALSMAATTGVADNNSGAPSANDVIVFASYA